MGKRCVVACCSNTHKDGVSLFKFPANEVIRMKWVKGDQTTRACCQPSEYSYVCSEHFTKDCFKTAPLLSGILYQCQEINTESLQVT